MPACLCCPINVFMSNPSVPSALCVLGEELYAGWGRRVNAFDSFKVESNQSDPCGRKASILARLCCSIAEFYPVLFILSDTLRSLQQGW